MGLFLSRGLEFVQLLCVYFFMNGWLDFFFFFRIKNISVPAVIIGFIMGCRNAIGKLCKLCLVTA